MDKIKDGSCPCCGKKIMDYDPRGRFGSPIRVCPSCKREYIDESYREIALDGMPERKLDTGKVVKLVLIILAITAVSGIMLYMGSDSLKLRITFFASILAFVLVLGRLIYIKSGMEQRAWQKEAEQSAKRLEDKAYAIKLKQNGFDVPLKYL